MNQRFCNGMVHVIKEGETLYQLSRMYRIPVALLMRANPYVDVYNLQPGQEICIPMSRPFPGMMPNFKRPQPGPEPPCQGEEKREDGVEVVSESEPVQDVEKTEQAEKPEKITWQSDGEASLGSVLKKCNCSLDEWFAVNDPDGMILKENVVYNIPNKV